ncbi:MAG: hypothetical protein WD335_00525 [Candidatus Paceibacterota bacterium]
MKNSWKIVILATFLVLIGQILGVRFDLYTGDVVWLDLVLHVISGAVLAMVWIIISRSRVQTTSLLAFTFLAGSFALFGSFAWEVFELAVNQNMPELAAEYSLRSSTVTDAITDMLGGFVGGLIWGFLSFKNNN